MPNPAGLDTNCKQQTTHTANNNTDSRHTSEHPAAMIFDAGLITYQGAGVPEPRWLRQMWRAQGDEGAAAGVVSAGASPFSAASGSQSHPVHALAESGSPGCPCLEVCRHRSAASPPGSATIEDVLGADLPHRLQVSLLLSKYPASCCGYKYILQTTWESKCLCAPVGGLLQMVTNKNLRTHSW